MPVPYMPRIPTKPPDSVDQLAPILRGLATFHVVRSLATYQLHSPLPPDWFSVRFSSKPDRAHEASPRGALQLYQDDVLSYAVSNRTDNHPVYVHMLGLNASWTVSTLLWNTRIPPRQQRTGDLTMTLPPPANDGDDHSEAEDTILVIFCVGEQCAENLVSASEWLRSVYLPPVLLGPEMEGRDVPVWPFYLPPPNWLVKSVTVRTVRRTQEVRS